MARKHTTASIAERLRGRLTPEHDRQPLLTCQTWLIHWRPDASRADRLCVGVALRIGDDIVTRLVTDQDLAQLGFLLTPVQLAQVRTLLNATDVRLRHGNAEPPTGIHYDAPKEAKGDSVSEIVDLLWQFGPGLVALQPPTSSASLPTAPQNIVPGRKRHKA